MARRSARLASASKKATPSPAPQLDPVSELNETSISQSERPRRRLDTIVSSPIPQSLPKPATPAVATPVKLPMSEMHPSKVHPTTAAPSSGLNLGFADIDYNKKTLRMPGAIQSTPSKTPVSVPSADFTFRYTMGKDAGLSPIAKMMMSDVRKDAAKLKPELAVEREQEKQQEAEQRKVRQAIGKAGRFSAAHMAEFKKMDSIANHPSAFRSIDPATPLKPSLKRARSKADLDAPDSLRSKKSSSRLAPSSPEKREEPASPVKRVKQQLEDDVSTLRPASRDGSNIPRPKSSGKDSVPVAAPRSHLNNLMTPTKSSLARSASTKTPAKTLMRTQSKPDLADLSRTPSKSSFASLARISSQKGLSSLKKAMIPSNVGHLGQVQTPGRLDRLKSLLDKRVNGQKSQIPQLAASPSKTSLHQGVEDFPQAPLTAPVRKTDRNVGLTPTKSSIPRSKAMVRFQSGTSTRDKTPSKNTSQGDVTYPDLSAYCRDINGDTEMAEDANPPESVPGTFTFRSDHTIRFDSASPTGFGGAAGQASIRHVRDSVLPTNQMPGSFPRPSIASPNKENDVPPVGHGIPHGMSNKKRHRANWDEEEDEQADQRAPKKLRKNPTAEGHAVVAPRLLGRESPAKKLSKAPRTPSPQKSPQKKSGGLSLSRLNMLARPKLRK
ncbi:uncharacterized protein GGS22DRAFT_156775 [Annulohypoxylon maeteangense]|uniref:uncharacterized protein n=1 Tax=Annulohypoxylon maeteangense TaxID=1927788 RepID=UPI00200860D2|nr:uncharacterized protein GGS22DRAFT_156775 [Annulohypoxylon maeteangense]KAI0887326.1 hypothetical protein GGS22DRAFT_156775 [Annulohypoxylon maeteangense]